jgi:predicted PurR-regulated permease PerM
VSAHPPRTLALGTELPASDAARVQELERRLARLEAERVAGAGGDAPKRAVVVDPRTVLMVLGVVAAAMLAGALVYLAWGALSLVLVAILVALALNPAVEFFVCRGWRRGPAATAVFLIALVVVLIVAVVAVPPIVGQVTDLVDGLPALAKGHGPLGFLQRQYHLVDHVRTAVGTEDSAVSVALGVAATGVSLVVVGFLTFFMLLEGPAWVTRLLDLAPDHARVHCERVGHGISRTVAGFVAGNVITAGIAGVLATVVLFATGVPYAIPLGLFVAFLDLLPIVGAILAIAVLGTVSLTQGLGPAIIVVGIFFVYHQLEVYYLRPVIYGRTIELSPLAVLVTVVIGTGLAGLLGAIAAIPIAGAIQAIVTEVAAARQAGRHRDIIEV